jgi:hypothetical protein
LVGYWALFAFWDYTSKVRLRGIKTIIKLPLIPPRQGFPPDTRVIIFGQFFLMNTAEILILYVPGMNPA